MRYSPEGPHLLDQVGRASINGDLTDRLTMSKRHVNEIPITVAVVPE